MGRPRKHARLHDVDGSARPCRHDLGADNIAERGEPIPTRELTDFGWRTWRDLTSAIPPGIFGETHCEILTVACETATRYDELQRSCKEPLSWLEHVKTFDVLTARFISALEKLGLTPTTKGKLQLSRPVSPDTPAATYFGETG
jgi:hypothetical protein